MIFMTNYKHLNVLGRNIYFLKETIFCRVNNNVKKKYNFLYCLAFIRMDLTFIFSSSLYFSEDRLYLNCNSSEEMKWLFSYVNINLTRHIVTFLEGNYKPYAGI